MSIEIRVLGSEDKAAFFAMRLEALRNEPRSFFPTVEESENNLDEHFAGCFEAPVPRNEQILYGAFINGKLGGIAGLSREERSKRNHIAWLRSVYVTPSVRGKGVGKQLMIALIERAKQLEGITMLELSVEYENEYAKRIYRELGFRSWGVEPAAMIVDGQEYAEEYMLLRI